MHDVNTVELILVILLSVGFLILITLSIVLLSFMLAIARNLKRMSDRAEAATSSVAGILESLGNKVGPLAFSGIVSLLVKRFMGKHKSGKEE
ncbi:MAG TPA: hypothetical protein VHQ86_04225 [Candidatus Saccharimonadia bacterium]|nr:hypothetical protein [Candidatus Saccharimonadia bacterium]